MKDDQNLWNFIFSIFFIVLLFGSAWYLWDKGELPSQIALFDLVLIILASFRLTRLFVYDKIAQFVRDLFLQKTKGEGVVVRNKYVSGPRRTISDLLSCPWCFGFWAAFVVTFFYYATEFAWYVILILAISGVATFIQLLANMIGWRAENLKQKTERH